MNAKELITEDDLSFLVETRRTLHRHPEVGFDLPVTTALVREKLMQMGITELRDYGTCSVCAYLGPKNAKFTLGFRADMDALPVEEKTGLDYASEIPGRMHACGHDSHTAILLTAARVLKRVENKLNCRVKLLFQPNEEGEISGARMMTENGAADDVDALVAIHCENGIESGCIGVHAGDYMAACDPVCITFHGRTAHASRPETGIDALSMAVEAYPAMKAAAKEIAGDRGYIFCVGSLKAGEAHNVVPDTAVMRISFRYYDGKMREEIHARCVQICEEAARKLGGSVDVEWNNSCPAVINDPKINENFMRSAEKVAPSGLVEMPSRMSSEDFSWFLTKKPGILFRYGTRSEAKGCTAMMHCNDFRIDEDAMQVGVGAFVQFALDQEEII